MKKHTSVFLFYVRNKTYKVLLILAAMAAVSIGGFVGLGFLDAPIFGGNHGDLFLGGIAALGYAGCIFSCTELPSAKSKSGYTLQRLQITEREALVWDALTNLPVFLAFYATQLLILCTVAKLYAAAPGYLQGEQGIVTAFYRNATLHGMLPLSEKGLWIRNLLFMVVSGVECACSSLNFRAGRKLLDSSIYPTGIIVLRFPVELGRETYFFPLIIVAVGIYSFISTFLLAHNGKRRENDETTG